MGMSVFDQTLQKTMNWIHELNQELNFETDEQTFSALRVVLHVLRDRLPVEEAAHLGAQLPMLLTGVYYDGWKPSAQPVRMKLNMFLQRVGNDLPDSIDKEPEEVVRHVFKFLGRKISQGELEDIGQNLPQELSEIWEMEALQKR